MHLTLTFLFPEKLILEKLDLQESADTPVRDTSSSSQFPSPGSSRFSSSPVVSCSREQSSDGSHGHGDRKVTATGLPRRKRMQTEGAERVCDTVQPDTSSMNASKRLCTSRYFSSPEDCTDADLDLDF